MPPKKKSGGRKKGKKSSKKKEKEPQLTIREAILAFQIEVKERDLQELTQEFRILREKNRRLKQRNEQLKNEQQEHIKTLLKQAKESEKEVEQITVVRQEEVEKGLCDKINTMRMLIAEQEEMKNQIKEQVDQIEEANKAIAKRTEYKDVGQHVHAKQIGVLKKKLTEMETSFNEVSAHLDRSLAIFKDEIQQQALTTMVKQKSVASEEAANSINNNDQQEIADHKWLKKEISIHTRACEDMTVVVEALEKENLEIMQELFDCKVQDLNLARKFYLACANDQSSSDEEEEVFAHHGQITSEEEVPAENLFDNYFYFEDEESSESPRLGPMELQLLSVVGTKKPLHKCVSDEVVSGSESKSVEKTDSEVWPVSERMLQTLVIK